MVRQPQEHSDDINVGLYNHWIPDIPEAPRAKETGQDDETMLSEATRRLRIVLQDAMDRVLPVLAEPHSICSETPISSMCSRADASSSRVIITKSPAVHFYTRETPEKMQRYRKYLRSMSPDRGFQREAVSRVRNRVPSPTFSETVHTLSEGAVSTRSQVSHKLQARFNWSSAVDDSETEWEA